MKTEKKKTASENMHQNHSIKTTPASCHIDFDHIDACLWTRHWSKCEEKYLSFNHIDVLAFWGSVWPLHGRAIPSILLWWDGDHYTTCSPKFKHRLPVYGHDIGWKLQQLRRTSSSLKWRENINNEETSYSWRTQSRISKTIDQEDTPTSTLK